MANYAIGDIQGCYESLRALLSIMPLAAEDRIWLCGDLVNRGPQSLEVLRWAASNSQVDTVLGNHDLHLLMAACGERQAKRGDTFDEILVAEDREALLNWLRARPLVHLVGDKLLVHAGLHPNWSKLDALDLSARCSKLISKGSFVKPWKATRPVPPIWSESLSGQERISAALSIFVGVRCFDETGRVDTKYSGPPSSCPEGFTPWFELPTTRTEEVVFGHWAALGLHKTELALGLDSGCVWGGQLTAVRLEDRKIWQVDAQEAK